MALSLSFFMEKVKRFKRLVSLDFKNNNEKIKKLKDHSFKAFKNSQKSFMSDRMI
jgi:hypothetical protein